MAENIFDQYMFFVGVEPREEPGVQLQPPSADDAPRRGMMRMRRELKALDELEEKRDREQCECAQADDWQNDIAAYFAEQLSLKEEPHSNNE